jgi:hypothetical protein
MINELEYINEPPVLEEPIIEETPIAEEAPVIEEPSPQGDPKKKKKDMTYEEDGESVMSEMYDKGWSLKRATKKLNNKYGWGSSEQRQGLIDYYSARDTEKKKPGGSTSGDSTSGGGEDELDRAVGEPEGSSGYGHFDIGVANVVGKEHYLVSPEEYRKRYGSGKTYRLGSVSEGQEESDIALILRNEFTPEVLGGINSMSVDIFQRWVLSKVKNNPLFEGMLNQPENEELKSFIETSDLENPLIQYRDLMMDLLARIDGKHGQDLIDDREVLDFDFGGQAVEEAYPMLVEKPAQKTLDRLEVEFMDFYANAVKDALPTRIIESDSDLKDLEYYFRINQGYSFDFTGEGQIGNQHTWGKDGKIRSIAKVVGLTLANVFSWAFEKTLRSHRSVLIPGAPGGHAMPSDWVSPAEEKRDERKERIEETRSKMNTYKRDITESLGSFWDTGDFNELDNAASQSFNMILEGTPYIASGVALAWSGQSPKMIALWMSAYGTTHDAMRIENDISFDKFIDKKTGEEYSYRGDEQRDGVLHMIDQEDGDTQEDIERKIRERFEIVRDDSNRMWFLTQNFATSFVADYALFRLFHGAVQTSSAKGVMRHGEPVEILGKILKGMGIGLSQSSSTTMVDQYLRIMNEAKSTGVDKSPSEAFHEALEIAVGMAPVPIGMTTLGWSKGLAVHLAKNYVGRKGLNKYHREDVAKLMRTANNPRVTYKNRMAARMEILRLNQKVAKQQAEDAKFYDYVFKKKPADHDELSGIANEIQHILYEIKNIKESILAKEAKKKGGEKRGNDAELAIEVYRKELESLIQRKTDIEDGHLAGYEASKKGAGPETKTDIEITATKKGAKQSLIDSGNKNPTPNQIAKEQVRLSEVDFRKTPEWIAQNIETKPKTTLTEEGLTKILDSEKYAILTGENPKGKGQGEAQNKAANDKLIKYLKDNGYVYHEVTGKYGSGENSILVENMSKVEAREIARIFDQHSVVTKKGLVKSDGSSYDFEVYGKGHEKEGQVIIDRTIDHTNPKADNYTTVKLADGTVVTFAMTAKNAKGPKGKTISGDDFWATGSENPLVREAQSRISDADAVRSLEKSNTKPKGKKGEYTDAQIRDKKIQIFNDAALKATQGEGGTIPIRQLPGMTPGTKAWNKMLAGVDALLKPTSDDGGIKTKEPVPPTSKPPSNATNNTPKGPITNALNKLGAKLKGIYTNWFVTNKLGWAERGWLPWKRREGPGEKAGDMVTTEGRMKRIRQDELSRDALAIGHMLRDIKRDFRGKRVPDDQYKRHVDEIDKYLRGDDNARVGFLSENQRASLDYARQRVDGLSQIFIELMAGRKNLTKGERAFIEKVKSNQGAYLKRSYQAFSDNGKWIAELNLPFSEMPASKKALIDDAVRFVMDEEGKTFDQAQAAIRGYIQDIAGGFKNGSIPKGEGPLGALNTRMFKGRKEIPEAFRRLLGEIVDPIYNYAVTVDKLGSYIGAMQFQAGFSDHLISTGLARPTDANGTGPQGWVRLADQGKAFDILSDVWVLPEFKKMYDDMQPLGPAGGPASKTWVPSQGDLFRLYLRAQATVKGYKTVYSPGTVMRNLESGILLSANAGHWFLADFKNIPDLMRTVFQDQPGLTKNQKTMEIDKLKRLGVIGDTARAGEYIAMMRDYTTASAAVVAAEAAGGRGLKAARNRFNAAAMKIYAFGDDYYKLSGFYQEVRGFMKYNDPKTGKPYTRADAEARAAERIRGGYPTYSGLPRNIKYVRRFFGTGMFVSFAYEVPRTTVNNYRYALQDFHEGRTKMGIQRLLGLGLSSGIVAAIAGRAQMEYGWDEDDTRAVQDVGPEWGENSKFVPVSEGEDGVLRFVDLSTIVPNEVWERPLRTLFRDGIPTMERFEAAAMDLLKPYVAVDATTNLTRELMTGQKTNGGTIGYWDKDKHLLENIDENWDNILKHMLVGVGPGYFRNIQDFARANGIAPEFFGGKANEYKEYTNEDAILRLLGVSVQSFDLGLATPWRVSDEARDYRDYKKFHEKADKIDLWMGKDFPSGELSEFDDPTATIINKLNKNSLTMDRVAGYNGDGPDWEYLEEYGTERALKQYHSFVRAQEYADLAFKSGISEEKFLFTLQDAYISKDDAAALWLNAQGEVPLSLAKMKLKEKIFLELREKLGWESAPRTVDDVKDPTKREIAAYRDELLEKRGDRDMAPWGLDLISKERTNTLRERVIYIQNKLGSPQSVVDAKIEQLYSTIAKVNQWYADEWARLNGGTPGPTIEEQEKAAEEYLRKKDEQQEED